MKQLCLLVLLLPVVNGATAQPRPAPPSERPAPAAATTLPRGFLSKQKTAAPTPGLARRLGADVVNTHYVAPNARARTAPALTTLPLRLRVVRDTAAGGQAVFIENLRPTPTGTSRPARVSATRLATQFVQQVRPTLQLTNAHTDFAVQHETTDELGQTHVRLQQTYRGVPVLGAELIAHVADGAVTALNGRAEPITAEISVQPRLKLPEALAAARRDVGKTSVVRSFGGDMLKLMDEDGSLCVYPTPAGPRLAYELTVRPNFVERWQYVVDAQTGAVLDKYNHTCSFDGPVRASARDLNGVTRTIQTYQHTDNRYYLIDASRPMFNKQSSKMPNDPVGALWTIDIDNADYTTDFKLYQVTSTNNTNWTPTAVSAHYNVGIAYDYYRTTFNRNALNGQGGTMISLINVADKGGKGLDNAFWNGKVMMYGNGNVAFKPLAGGLDVAGHEMTHGVIGSTARLEYRSQSGAINESMADVFAVLIDRDDWTLGEDVVKRSAFPSGAMRSFVNPNQNGRGVRGWQPKHMNEYMQLPETEEGNNGGVHINSGIPNHAFYRFATAVGKGKAERVYYRALTTYLVRTSQFIDLRLAVIRAATDLYGANGTEAQAARAAFDAVGITEGNTPPDDGKKPDLPTASGPDLLLLADAENRQLYTTVVGTDKFTRLTTSTLKRRPSVTDDGQFAYYVSDDKKIRAVNLKAANPTEQVLSNEAIWANVAISRDGTKLAALTEAQDASVWVYHFATKKWKQFKLSNPTTAQGVSTGEVKYADSFEWDFSGEYIVYDAYNALSSAAGDNIDYWDVGFLRAWDKAKNDFGSGRIEKLFSSLEEGESIGNPSYSKNSPDIIAFDYFNEPDDAYYVLGADLSQGQLKLIYENNTLGFPGYSRLDNRLLFNVADGTDENVAGIGLLADKITPTGKAQTLYTGAKWPVWYTTATRQLAARTAQTITFGEVPDQYLSEPTVTLRATASSGLPVAFALVSGPATLAGSRLTLTGVGTVRVRAAQAGNDQFAPAPAVERSFAVLTVLGLEPAWSSAVQTYPNPTQSLLTVELPTGAGWQAMRLTTLGGSVVQQLGGAQQGGAPTQFDLSRLPAGMYLLSIDTDQGRVQRKILKQ